MNDSDVLKAFGESVRTQRGKLGLSQEQLAQRASLDRTYVGGVERGERNVGVKNIWKLANALGVHASELFLEHKDV